MIQVRHNTSPVFRRLLRPAALSLSVAIGSGCGGSEDTGPIPDDVGHTADSEHSGSGSSGGADSDGGNSNGDNSNGDNSDACEAVATAPLIRLAVLDYERSLRQLVGDSAVDAVQGLVDALPVDDLEPSESFGREDHRVTDRHIEGWYRIADGIATRISNDADLRADILGPCAAANADESCLRNYLPAFLLAAFRRPAAADEIDHTIERALELDEQEVHLAVIFQTLMSPAFLYHFETRGTAVDDTTLELTPFELASRLAFHFWGAPADAELLVAAQDGVLNTEDGYRAQVERIFASPRTAATQRQFFGEWLRLERGGFANGPRLEILAQGIDITGLADEMRDEAHDLIEYHLRSNTLTWHDVLQSQLSFARSERLARLYGADIWDGGDTPPTLPAGERSGLFTRAGLLYTADGSTNPFRRGAFVRRAILCDPLAPPPSDLPPDALTPPPVAPGTSTREAFEQKVEDPLCQSCHVQFADLGYALESYDGLGRFRTSEQLVSADGIDHGIAPIDALVTPRVEFDDDRPTNGAAELVDRMIESTKPNACLAETYFRFTHRRANTPADACSIGDIEDQLFEGGSLRDALRSVALAPQFRLRRLED
ncbi:MAG: DUF1592 domain-containing protein [Nannocystaceae bacterium]